MLLQSYTPLHLDVTEAINIAYIILIDDTSAPAAAPAPPDQAAAARPKGKAKAPARKATAARPQRKTKAQAAKAASASSAPPAPLSDPPIVSDIQQPLARWWFVAPHALQYVVGQLSKYRKAGNTWKRVPLEEWRAVQERAFKHFEEQVVIERLQMHGEMVRVPVGWAHAVDTLQPCVKVAWDLWLPEHAAHYFEVVRLSAACAMSWPKDYQMVQSALLDWVREAAEYFRVLPVWKDFLQP